MTYLTYTRKLLQCKANCATHMPDAFVTYLTYFKRRSDVPSGYATHNDAKSAHDFTTPNYDLAGRKISSQRSLTTSAPSATLRAP